ncbi:phage terminase large subunit [Escherichia coli]|uniref:phage terminase large subunit n=1 Tax=Escherichia coli TaxID=562 RepID=UPI000E21597B|nr:phage terminase large subunit [Escherichia coli]
MVKKNSETSYAIPFAPRRWQREANNEIKNHQQVVLNIHRGGGKTVFCVMKIILAALYTETKGIPAKFAYVGESRAHAKQTVWETFTIYLRDMVRAGHVQMNNSDLTIKFPNGNMILLSGYDDPERNRGLHLTGLILDEAQSCPEDTWNLILAPTLNQNNGWCIIIGTPNGPDGLFYNMWQRGNDPGNHFWYSITKTIEDTGEMPPHKWDAILATYDKDTIAQEYFCDFNAAVKNRIYYNFDNRMVIPATELKKPHLDSTLKDRGGALYVGMDYNVAFMPCIIAQKNGNRFEVLREIIFREATTDKVAERLRMEFPNRQIIICPDASGANAGTAQVAGSNHAILRRYGFSIMAPKKNPKVDERLLAVNVLLENALGDRRLFIHPSCKELIKTLTHHTYKNGSPDKTSGLDHCGDALGYLVMQTFPIRRVTSSVKELRI